MNDLLAALLLGIIEGITEFLPISSTGHLLIAERWLGHRSDLFNISIQAGAILAVVLIYRQRLIDLTLGLRERNKRDYVLKLLLAFGVTAALGIVVKTLGFELPETIEPVAWALLLGGFIMLGAEAIDARRVDLPDDDPNAIGWGTAVLVGLAQVLAGVFPGTSRSAAAIFAALLFGKSTRLAATEFAFLVGIPTMFAATGYELMDMLGDGSAANEDWSALGVAFVASAVTAFVAVKWLLRYIQTHRFTVFAWYRIAFGAALLVWLHASVVSPANAASAGESAVTRALPADQSRNVPRTFLADASSVTRATLLSLPSTDAAENDGAPAGNADTNADIARFRSAKLCVQAAMARVWVDQSDVESFVVPASDPFFTEADRQLQIDESRKLLDLVERAESECADSVDALDGSIYELALRAAKAGDEIAAGCFVGGRFPMPPDLWQRADVRDRFREHAIPLMERGLRRGSWPMVTLAALSISPSRGRHAMTHVPALPTIPPDIVLVMSAFRQGDAERAYALARLREIGAADRMKGVNNGFIKATARKLTPLQRNRAEAWAQDAFVRYFRGRKWDRYDTEPCPIS